MSNAVKEVVKALEDWYKTCEKYPSFFTASDGEDVKARVTNLNRGYLAGLKDAIDIVSKLDIDENVEETKEVENK